MPPSCASWGSRHECRHAQGRAGRGAQPALRAGNRPERFAKALASGADAVILDLEDAVPEAEKAEARRAILAQWPALRASPTPLLLRLNAPGTPEWREDLGLPGQLPGLAGLICPKAESAAPLAALAPEGLPLIPLIESAHGWAALAEIAGAPGVLRVALGHIDFMADTGLDDSAEEEALAPLRFAIAMHSRLAGLASAIDGVTVQTGDEARLAEDAKRALRFGFGAKLCIHPRQIEPCTRPCGPHRQSWTGRSACWQAMRRRRVRPFSWTVAWWICPWCCGRSACWRERAS